MAFENADQAAQALADAMSAPDSGAQQEFTAGAQTGAPQDANQLTVQPTPPQGEPGDQGAPQEPQVPEFTPSKDIDLSGLSDDQREYLQAREREMQAHFTRTMQEVSQQRQEAEQAVQFINELNTNPYFAQQVVQELSANLQASGLTPAQADFQAQQQVAGASNQPQQQEPDLGLGEFDDDDPYMAEIRALREQQGQVQQFLAQQAEQQRYAALESQLMRQAAAVQTNYKLSDQDMNQVVDLAYAYGGNLETAAQQLKQIRDNAISGYLNEKGSVTAPAPVPAGGAAQTAPQKFEGLNDPRLEQAAMARLNAVLGNQS